MLLRYCLRRLALALPLLLGISLLTFGLLHLAPGSPVMSESAMSPGVSPESIQSFKQLYGLDRPLHEQYFSWLKRIVLLDFGRSFRDQREVLDKIAGAFPATALLNCLALTLVLGLAVPLGVFSATRLGSRAERLSSAFSFLAWSMPSFWLAMMLQLSLGLWLGIFPISGFQGMGAWNAGWLERAADVLWHLALPLITASFGAWAVLARYVRNSVLEALSQDYVRTARAKGLPERAVIRRHVLPNALLPLITYLGLAVPGLISGSVLVETIFAWPGMGRLAWEAATGYDYPVIMGLTVIGALLTILGNLAADLAYAWLDPRIKYA